MDRHGRTRHSGAGTQARHWRGRCGAACIRIHRPAPGPWRLPWGAFDVGPAMKRLGLLLSCPLPLHAATAQRMGPENGWAGMHREVELMPYGEDIAGLQARIAHPGARVSGVQALENPELPVRRRRDRWRRHARPPSRSNCSTATPSPRVTPGATRAGPRRRAASTGATRSTGHARRLRQRRPRQRQRAGHAQARQQRRSERPPWR